MCLIFLSYQQNPRYPLIILANRDEFYGRPTEQAAFWSGNNVLAGKDLVAGGTWLGITKRGSMAMITNYRDLANLNPNAPTRGKLVSDFLRGDLDAKRYLVGLDSSADFYNGYNIILGSLNDPWYYSNYQKKIYQLGSGLYGLSNELLDSPWPKVSKGKSALADLFMADGLNVNQLFEQMLNREEAPVDNLPDTGIGLTKEKALSPMFIKTKDYGTRCSTLITLDNTGKLYFEERTYHPDQTGANTVAFNLTI